MNERPDPIEFEYFGTQYHLFPSYDEEFPDQIVQVRRVEIPNGKEVKLFPGKQTNECDRLAFETALSQVGQSISCENLMIDHFD